MEIMRDRSDLVSTCPTIARVYISFCRCWN